MKKKVILITLIALLIPLFAGAQNLDDVLRYSQLNYQGTARFNAMGGAFTALGGDLSALSLNPAGAALFRSTEVAFTPLVIFRNTNTDYNGYEGDNNYSGLNLGQVGLVTSLNTRKGSLFSSLTIAYTYNRTNNYYRHSVIDGISTDGSMADYWAMQANGTDTWDLGGRSYMAYESYLIDTVPGYYDQYESIFSYYGETSATYGQRVRRVIDNSGYSNEHNITIGANIGDKIYLGAGIGITNISYTGHYEHTETDENQAIYDLVDFTYTDHFKALGTGVNFKIGAIVRPVESLRIGLSFTTPTLYNMNEWFYYGMSTYLDNDTPADDSDDANPEISLNDMTYSYRITTPYHINAGVAYQIGNFALLSVDYEYIDYGTGRLSNGSDGYDFYDENQDLVAELGSAGNLRVGAEAHFGPLYLRGGYKYSSSAFLDGTLNENAHSNGYSAGIGYRQNKFYVDMSMAWLSSNEEYMMYPDDNRSTPLYNSDPVYINTNDKYLSLTIGMKF